MPRAPVHHLTKKEIEWLGANSCKHHHSFLEHYSCYLDEHGGKQLHGFLDIESSNLSASYGILLCWCIYDRNNDIMYEDCITKEDLKGNLDKRVVQSAVDTMRKFTWIYTFYGTKFDLPFLRTRAIVHGIDFPKFKSGIYHKDVYYIVRNKFKLHSNRLAVACEILLGETDKTRIDPGRWTKALMGDKEALDYILEHCRYDVTDLAKLHRKVEDYAGKPGTSI